MITGDLSDWPIFVAQKHGDTYFYNRVGVAIFMVTAHGQYMIGAVGGVGCSGGVTTTSLILRSQHMSR